MELESAYIETLKIAELKQIVALKSQESLQVLNVVRVVPSKRIVCHGIWKKQQVYAKMFFGKKAKYYADRDQRGVNALTQASIPTPELLATDQTADGNCEVLIFKAIEDSSNVEAIYTQANPTVRLNLAISLIKTLAQHHQAKLIQTDLYLKNFLIKDDKIFTLDGDGIRSFKSLSASTAIKNLIRLLSKLDIVDVKHHLQAMLNCYQENRPSNLVLKEHRINEAVDIYRQKVTNAYASKKVFRQCTDISVNKKQGYFSARANAYAHLSLPSNSTDYDALIQNQTILKQGRTCTVSLADFNDTSVVIKRYNIKNFSHKLGRMLRTTRAARSWENAHRLKLLNLPTPDPIALLEQRKLGLRGKAYFLSAYVDAPDALQYFKQTTAPANRKKAIHNISYLFYQLYLLKISHGDMKASNIKVLENNMPLLIDLDSMQQHQYALFSEKAHARDIKRFMQNWKDEPSLYNAFLEALKNIYTDHAPLHAAHVLK